jgi:hypothetical protein
MKHELMVPYLQQHAAEVTRRKCNRLGVLSKRAIRMDMGYYPFC